MKTQKQKAVNRTTNKNYKKKITDHDLKIFKTIFLSVQQNYLWRHMKRFANWKVDMKMHSFNECLAFNVAAYFASTSCCSY